MKIKGLKKICSVVLSLTIFLSNFSVTRYVKAEDVQLDYNTKCQNFVPIEGDKYDNEEVLTEEDSISNKNFNNNCESLEDSEYCLKDLCQTKDNEEVCEPSDGSTQINYSKKYKNFVPDEKFKLKFNCFGKYDFRVPNKDYDDELACELFPNGLPQVDDVVQGKTGICYYLAAIASIVDKNPQLIKDAMVDNNDGTVTVKVYDFSTAKPIYVTVQKTIPNVPYNLRVLGKECLWVELLLKALIASGMTNYAGGKFINTMDYRDANGGISSRVLEMITGKKCDTYRFPLSVVSLKVRLGEEKTYDKIKNSIDNGSGIITCSFNRNIIFNMLLYHFGIFNNCGLVKGHTYSVQDAYEDENGQKWVVVRNPWGYFSTVYDEKGKRVHGTNDKRLKGYSYIRLEDFCENCDKLDVLSNEDLEPESKNSRVVRYGQKLFLLVSKNVSYIITAKLILSYVRTLKDGNLRNTEMCRGKLLENLKDEIGKYMLEEIVKCINS